jgi:hypothetical protein
MEEMYLLTAADRKVLQDAVELTKKLRINPANRPSEEEVELQPPEVYVALSPQAGIAAADIGAGTGGVVGTAGNVTGVTPGAAECYIYKLDYSTGDFVYAGFTKPVYNYSLSAVAANTFVLTSRDKWGVWYAITSMASSVAFSGCKNTSVASLEDGVEAILVLADPPEFDIGDYYNSGFSSLYTIPQSGYYRVDTSFMTNTGIPVNMEFLLSIAALSGTNSDTFTMSGTYDLATFAAVNFSLAASYVGYYAAGDKLQFAITQYSVPLQTVDLDAVCSIYKLGT